MKDVIMLWRSLYRVEYRDFPGSPVVKTLHFHCRGMDLIPDQGTKIPHDTWPRKKKSGVKMSESKNIKSEDFGKQPPILD